MASVIDKYLQTADSRALSRVVELADRSWDATLVVPVRNEHPQFADQLLHRLPHDRAVLLIVVVNEGPHCPPEVRAANRELLATCPPKCRSRAHHLGCALGSLAPHLDLLVVDRTGPRRLEPDGGVGHARKVGFDLALALHRAGLVRSSLLHGTDADAKLPASHLDDTDPDTVARTASFWHLPSGNRELDRATALYELWLRHYVAGLRSAGSPYAHHSIGSCISVRADAYARVRGVPKRQAGEDFHLMAKLAKLGPVARTSAEAIALRSRPSLRVPFGTGRAALDHARGHRTILFYQPALFDLLAGLLRSLASIEAPGDIDRAVRSQPSIVRDTLGALGAPEGMTRACSSATDPTQRRRRVMEWLDALRTLKFLHGLRDRGFPSRPWSQIALQTPYLHLDGPLADIDEARRALDAFERRVAPRGALQQGSVSPIRVARGPEPRPHRR